MGIELEYSEKPYVTATEKIIADLELYVDMMRRRGVAALKVGDIAITLATVAEPPAVAGDKDRPVTDPDELRERARQDKMMLYYGSLPRSQGREVTGKLR